MNYFSESRHPCRIILDAALSIPLTVDAQGTPCPGRSLILYITFVVILLTLVIQGLTLPVIIRHTRFPDFHDHLPLPEAEDIIRRGMAQTGLDYLKSHHKEINPGESKLLDGMVRHWEEQTGSDEVLPLYQNEGNVYLEILEARHQYLCRLSRQRADIDEDVVRRFVRRIDLEVERIKNE